jgi:hypothetical protein
MTGDQRGCDGLFATVEEAVAERAVRIVLRTSGWPCAAPPTVSSPKSFR